MQGNAMHSGALCRGPGGRAQAAQPRQSHARGASASAMHCRKTEEQLEVQSWRIQGKGFPSLFPARAGNK